MLFAVLAGSWAFTSLYLRYVVAALFVFAAILCFRRARRTFGRSTPGWRMKASFAVLVPFAILDALAIASYLPPLTATDVSFPLRGGSYAVIQGGDSVVTNPFHAMSDNGLALDIVRLNGYGNRAAGPAPEALEDYAIFGDTVLSPCGGTVDSARNDVPDFPPGNPDTKNASGNFVIVRCAGVEILLAHMRRGSVTVAAGAPVTRGQPLGQVGNSGYTLEPHLHIGATRRGVPTNLTFDGRTLSVNSTVR